MFLYIEAIKCPSRTIFLYEIRRLPVVCWEMVLTDVLHAIRSLLCTATNVTPHERMFKHPRRSSLGITIPSWLTTPGPVFLRNYTRTSKYQPLVDEVDLVEANPNYAKIRYKDGRESNVSIRDLAPVGSNIDHIQSGSSNEIINESVTVNKDVLVPVNDDSLNDQTNIDQVLNESVPDSNIDISSCFNKPLTPSDNSAKALDSNTDVILVKTPDKPEVRRGLRNRKAPIRLDL